MFELVLAGGRVIDPETRLDGPCDVGISGGRIGAVSQAPLTGTRVIDVAGQVVAPGFIDLHSHAQDLLGQRLQALDGVTTALELEAGTLPVAAALSQATAQGRLINFGYSASWALARAGLLDGADLSLPAGPALSYLTGPGWRQPASDKILELIVARLDEALAEGAIGVGVLLGYAPDTAPAEYRRIAQLAARRGVPVFTHARWIGRSGPRTSLDGAAEVIAAGRDTGAHMHLCHVNSTSDVLIGQVADAISAARESGTTVSTEAYPYGASSTIIGSPFFDPAELRRRGQSPRALTYLATGERVASDERLLELRATDPGGLVIFDWLDLDTPAGLALLDRSLLLADTAMASDALPARLVAGPPTRRPGHRRPGPGPTRVWPGPSRGPSAGWSASAGCCRWLRPSGAARCCRPASWPRRPRPCHARAGCSRAVTPT